MSRKYSLKVRNHAAQAGSFYIFLRNPAQAYDPNLYSVVWLCKYTHPQTEVKFEWNLDYQLSWGATGPLGKDVFYQAMQTQRVDPCDSLQNAFQLKKDGDAYCLQPSETPFYEKYLSVYTDETVPPRSISFGVGVSGTPAFAYQATPYYHYKFVPKLEYWVAFGNFTQGQILTEEPDKIVNAHQFEFPENIYDIGLDFAPKDPWSQIK